MGRLASSFNLSRGQLARQASGMSEPGAADAIQAAHHHMPITDTPPQQQQQQQQHKLHHLHAVRFAVGAEAAEAANGVEAMEGRSAVAVAGGPPALTQDRSVVRSTKVRLAMSKAVRRHGSAAQVCMRFLHGAAKSRGWQITLKIFSNPMLWSLLLALVISLSGLRNYLYPLSPDYVAEMGWLVDTLRMLAATTVPLALFSNGSFLYGKRFWEGNVKKAIVVLAIKILVLPFLQLACTKACGLQTPEAMSLILLSVCPCATTSFVVASQYNHGAEVITMVTVIMTVLLVPLMLAALNVPQALGLYTFDISQFPLP